jgi:hypothetical protein
VNTVRGVLGIDDQGQYTMWEACNIVAASLRVSQDHAHMMLYLDFEHGILPGITDTDEIWFARRDLHAWLSQLEELR